MITNARIPMPAIISWNFVGSLPTSGFISGKTTSGTAIAMSVKNIFHRKMPLRALFDTAMV